MAKYVLHYAGAEFIVEGASAIELIDGMEQPGIMSIPTESGPVALVCGSGIPIWIEEVADYDPMESIL